MGNDIPLSLSLRFEGTLVRQVRQFQSAHGLVADGVVGPHTIIHLNSAHRADVPRLLEVPSDD
jgi:murein L,D-transpeptidase YcbB/YkuD